MLQDSFGRTLRTLRVSVTDRCDLRCAYCMPATGAKFVERQDLLSQGEFVRAIEAFLRLGITRLKFTGGEPLLRTDLEELIETFAGRVELGLTTNGSLLTGRAAGLWKAGLRKLTVSVDTLHPGHYAALTRGGDLRRVLDGLKAATELGFKPIKINAVLFDQPLEELLQLAALSLSSDLELRFIEYMPVSFALEDAKPKWKPAALRQAIEAAFGALEPLGREQPASPAASFRIQGAPGRLGFISSVSEPFCAACDRVRLQANGFVRLCMARPEGVQLRDLLRERADDSALDHALRQAAWNKPSGHAFYTAAPKAGAQMSSIGG
jgi:cyclic pyranopterin phosphate synthase